MGELPQIRVPRISGPSNASPSGVNWRRARPRSAIHAPLLRAAPRTIISPLPSARAPPRAHTHTAVPSLHALAVTGGVASLQLLGGLAIASPGGELCGGVMLAAYQVIAAYEVLPRAPLVPVVRELALLGAIGLVFGYALDRQRSRVAVGKKTA